MSELATLEKAIENSQKEVKELIEEQRKSINQNGEINKQLQTDLANAQDELKTTGTRLFDLEQKLAGKVKGKHPVFEITEIEAVAEYFGKLLPFVFLNDDLTVAESLKELVDIIVGTLGQHEFAGGNIEEGNP